MHYDDKDARVLLGPPLARISACPPFALTCLVILLVNGAVILWLLLLGRSFLPESVPLQLWNASLLGAHNSQHVADFYSLLHAMSGAALYFAARAICPEWPLHRRFIMVIACGGVWEMVENTPWVIGMFNDPGSLNVYRGDSIVNALSDMAFIALGFLAAHSLPRWLIIAAGAVTELAVAVIIHDGFVLGTARLIWR